MQIDPAHVATVTQWLDTTYVFCSHDCARMFTAAPDRYVVTEADPRRA